jgi:hypothetical protein
MSTSHLTEDDFQAQFVEAMLEITNSIGTTVEDEVRSYSKNIAHTYYAEHVRDPETFSPRGAAECDYDAWGD